jgi:hypothetical protein
MKASALALFAAVVQSISAAPLSTKELVSIATRHGMPMPPGAARLVLAHTKSWSVLSNQSTSRDPGIYSPAFLLEDTITNIAILRGMERQTLVSARSGEPLWRPFSAEKIEPKIGGHVASFGNVSAFVCAVQLAARGDDKNCQAIWERFANEEWWESDGFRDSFKDERGDPALLLANCLFIHFRRELLHDQPDRLGILGKMKALFAEFPALKTSERAALLDDLSTTVSAKPSVPNSTEDLVLQLAQFANRRQFYGSFDADRANKAGTLRRSILLRGREAVPDLIGLLDDRRLTACEVPAVMNAPAHIERVGELVRSLLVELTGLRGASDAAAFREWLTKNQQLGEADALMTSVFQREGSKIQGINESVARILAERYPEKLPGLCEAFSKEAGPNAQPFSLAEAVAVARLPLETRVKVLTEFAQRGLLEHRRCVLQQLAALDSRKCAELLSPIIEKLPADVSGSYWTCPEAALTHVVMRIEDDGIWREYLRAAKRSSVGLRLEMMNPMCYTYIGKTNRERRLAFLSALLDDETLRDKSNPAAKYDGPCAAFTIPKITVRDFAAEKIGSILGLAEHPDEFWTAVHWEELRNKVRAKLADSKLPTLEVTK